MADFYIAVGSNIDPETNLSEGLKLLSSRVHLLRVSTHYRTAPLGERRQPEYINGIWHGQTDIAPLKLKKTLGHIENHCGRVRENDPFASRTLDLDLILYEDLQLDSPELVIPNPEIKERTFIYIPLLELEPDIRLPGDKSPLAGLVNPDMELYYSPITEILRNLLDSGL
ncbi:2-amino-4-hydroxy-6-hydroxymethyldihydropteridine diphosphokinase [Marispirochaeta sp.]|uniref:2-amino-4-hydroxy-6- hydroxymethyldihydropteridine diphosphokinase n=1 Tax=Marispirochaeta sp. TaxID=2038653 RepID=UPI0029C6AA1C|nr:2-amino-4-hydroxy-6-hydroxymethyldihydropteridine diphosphokinase [Marispirochaeta sp.]